MAVLARISFWASLYCAVPVVEVDVAGGDGGLGGGLQHGDCGSVERTQIFWPDGTVSPLAIFIVPAGSEYILAPVAVTAAGGWSVVTVKGPST